MSTAGNSYDEVPYQSKAFPQSHPNRLATLAKLFGMKPAPVERCRVLELGCSSGGNLLDVAAQFPQSTCLGVDLSLRQVNEGREMVKAIGAKNIEIRHASIADVDESYGEFDYIVCHGVFSWVPKPIQDKILDVCRVNLAPQGVAYISYNTFPGWRMRGMIRDMMMYHSRGFGDPTTRIAQAKALLEFLAQSCTGEKDPYAIYLKNELEVLKACSDYYIFHDHLEDVNLPIYFYEFAERLDQHRLSYLGEAEFSSMAASNFTEEVQKTLQKIAPNIVKMEQYMDFLRNRMFRQTLVCHASVQLDRNIRPERVYDLFIASNLVPANKTPNLKEAGVAETFAAPNKMQAEVRQPIVKAALFHLAKTWPRPISFDFLLTESRALLGLPAKLAEPELSAARQELAGALLLCYRSRLIELHSAPLAVASEATEKPRATPLARLQAERGNFATNLRHEVVPLNAFDRQLLRFLDGSRGKTELVGELHKLVKDKVLKVESEGKPVEDEKVLQTSLTSAVDQTLPTLAKRGLLLA